MKKSEVMKSGWVIFATVACITVFGLSGAGFVSIATASGTPTTSTTIVQSASNSFCFPATKLVGTYSVNVERALGLNDNRPPPNRMTAGIKAAVKAFANSSLSLSKKAPTVLLASQLRRLSVELKQSNLPIDVVRAEAAFGATGYRDLGLLCHSATKLMTPTNPLGGFNPE
jgi:hypothetical protein